MFIFIHLIYLFHLLCMHGRDIKIWLMRYVHLSTEFVFSSYTEFTEQQWNDIG